MKRKAKDYGWPHMFYCKADGTYLACDTLADVPKGFVDTRMECDIEPVGEPSPYTGPRPATASEEAALAEADEDEDDDGEDNDTPDEVPGKTLEEMGIKRKEALAMLKEEGVKVPQNAKNDVIAGLVEELLEEETED